MKKPFLSTRTIERFGSTCAIAFPHPYTRADAEQWVQLITQITPETNFAIDVNGEAVGGIGLVLHDDVERCSAEVGYWLGENYWGRGIATAALKNFTEYAFNEFNLTRVYAVPYARNAASIRVLEKAGYTYEGLLRRSAIKDGSVLDQFIYAKTDSNAASQNVQVGDSHFLAATGRRRPKR